MSRRTAAGRIPAVRAVELGGGLCHGPNAGLVARNSHLDAPAPAVRPERTCVVHTGGGDVDSNGCGVTAANSHDHSGGYTVAANEWYDLRADCRACLTQGIIDHLLGEFFRLPTRPADRVAGQVERPDEVNRVEQTGPRTGRFGDSGRGRRR